MKLTNPQSGVLFTMEPQFSGRDAALCILKKLFETAKYQKNAVLCTEEPESIHDFRVALRRMRTLLGQVKGVLPEDFVNDIRNKISVFTKLSNVVRDSDVFIAKIEEYLSDIPDEKKGMIEPLLKFLNEKKSHELDIIKKALAGEEWEKALSAIKYILNDEIFLPESKNSNKPIKTLAQKILLRKFKKLRKEVKNLSNNPEREEIHPIRISCKHLRYLLEFFSSLFNKKLFKFIEKLKDLQDYLGEYSDISAHRQILNEYMIFAQAQQNTSKTIDAYENDIFILLDREMAFREKKAKKIILKKLASFCSDTKFKRFKKILR